MDRVRLGRALGYGARHAAKSLLAAADAAAAPAPLPSQDPARGTGTPPSMSGPMPGPMPRPATGALPEIRKAVHGATQTAARARVVSGDVARQAGRSFFSPLARFSSVVSLQVTGTFFALLALVMGQAVWRARAAAHFGAGSSEARRFYVLAAVFLLFSYFAASNFVRARRRERR